jgi:hypothetical protein
METALTSEEEEEEEEKKKKKKKKQCTYNVTLRCVRVAIMAVAQH